MRADARSESQRRDLRRAAPSSDADFDQKCRSVCLFVFCVEFTGTHRRASGFASLRMVGRRTGSPLTRTTRRMSHHCKVRFRRLSSGSSLCFFDQQGLRLRGGYLKEDLRRNGARGKEQNLAPSPCNGTAQGAHCFAAILAAVCMHLRTTTQMLVRLISGADLPGGVVGSQEPGSS